MKVECWLDINQKWHPHLHIKEKEIAHKLHRLSSCSACLGSLYESLASALFMASCVVMWCPWMRSPLRIDVWAWGRLTGSRSCSCILLLSRQVLSPLTALRRGFWRHIDSQLVQTKSFLFRRQRSCHKWSFFSSVSLCSKAQYWILVSKSAQKSQLLNLETRKFLLG